MTVSKDKMTVSSIPPKHLNQATKRWYIHVTENYELEQHHLRLLTLAGQAWDRAEQARVALVCFGLTFEDRFGAPHPRPEIAIERDARTAFARLLRELDLDVLPPTSPIRPAALRSNRRS
jgi:phage terminase small subunit